MRKIIYILLMAVVSLSLEGQILFRQDFGGNRVSDDSISQRIFRQCKYRQIFSNDDGSEVGTFSLRKKAFYNGNRVSGMKATDSQWFAQDDHTYPNDYTRGYFLQVDGSLENDLFYSFRIQHLRPGATIEFSAWFANLYTPYQRFVWEERHKPVALPDIDLIVLSAPDLDFEVARFSIGPIPYDTTLQEKNDYLKSSQWINYKFRIKVPDGTTTLYFVFGNRAAASPGDDFGIDDIVVKYIKK
ncbi:MAG: hypothetical protein MJ001_07585 [Paludibacteraceae bacterium]|nr:hypothetical protein [Paludibacteraceae bacterium]